VFEVLLPWWVFFFSLNLLSKFFAHINSVARIPNPRGITTIAGPGNTIIAIPMRSTVKPPTVIINLLTCFMLFKKIAVIKVSTNNIKDNQSMSSPISIRIS